MYLFVYGTLKKNNINHHKINMCKFYSICKTNNKYYYDENNNSVYYSSDILPKKYIDGELYIIPKESGFIKYLDNFENHPDYFYRRTIYVNIDGKKELAYMYFKT